MVYMKRLRDPSLFSFKKRKFLAAYSYLRGECKEDGGKLFMKAHGDRTGGNRLELHRKFQLDGRKTLSPSRWSDTGTSARQVVECPSLEILTTYLDKALSNLT